MRKLVILVLLLSVIVSCANKNEQSAKKSGQEIFFAQSTYDYGEIEEDSEGLYVITFKNIGDGAIVINRVRSTCGCTIPSWPRKPIESGEEGEIEVKYNTALLGSFMKSVYVYSTAANSPVKLTVKGKVVSAENTASEKEGSTKPEMPE